MVGGRGKDKTNLEAVKEDIEMSWTSSDEDDEEVLALMTEWFVLLNFTSFFYIASRCQALTKLICIIM